MNSKVKIKQLKQMKFIRSFGNIHEYKIEENGLKVILAQQPQLNSPIVTLMIRYNVGSRNEGVGYTGSAHILEHMLFKGSKNFDKRSGSKDIWQTLKPLGAEMNATTSKDRTNFFETLPLKYLEKALEVEADRMENAFIRQDDKDSEMTVVRNEFEIGENNPEEALYKKNWAISFEAHSYHHSTIGHRDDIENVPIEKLQEFYREYYNPENAALIVSGSFNIDPVLSMVQKHFSKLTRNKGVKAEHQKRVYTFENSQQGAKSFIIKKAGASNTLFTLSFKKPRSDAKDSVLVDMIASIMSDGKKSRFYKQFVKKDKLFSKAESLNEKVKDTGIVQFYFTLTENNTNNAEKNMDILRSKVMKEIENLSQTITQEEIDIAKQSYLNSLDINNFTSSMEMANFLNEFETLGDWPLFLTYKDEIEQATIQDFKNVIDKYFQVDYSTMGLLLPVNDKVEDLSVEKHILKIEDQLLMNKLNDSKEKFELQVPVEKMPKIDPDFIPKIKENMIEDIIEIIDPKKTPESTLDKDSLFSAKTKIRLLSYRKLNGEKIHLTGYFPAGYMSLPIYENVDTLEKSQSTQSAPLKSGEFVEKMKMISSLLPTFMKHGTNCRTAENIEAELEKMDSSVSFSSDDYYYYFTIRSKSENLSKTLMIAFDMLYNSSFEEKDLDEIKQLYKQKLLNSRQDPNSRAAKISSRELYEQGHRNRITETGILLSILPKLKAKDFKDYVDRYFKLSEETTLVKVGAETSVPLNSLLKRAFSMSNASIFNDNKKLNMNFKELKSKKDTIPVKNNNVKTLVKNIPEKTSTSVRIVQRIDQTFSDDDMVLLSIAVYSLGGAFDSRLMQRVRVEKGLTYGIRSRLQNYDYNSKGELFIGSSFAPENVDAGIKETMDVVSKWIVEGITEEELKNSKSFFSSNYQVELEQSSTVLGFVIESLTNGQDMDFFSNRIEKINSATLKQVNDSIKKYIDPTAFVIVKVGTFQ